MMNISQPSFWLDVKREYIIDNFENMLFYLQMYNYTEGENNSDFDKTFNCLKEIVDEILSFSDKDNLCMLESYKDYDNVFIIRIMACYLLACHKKNVQDLNCLLCLADKLILLDAVSLAKMNDKMFGILNSCICNKNVLKYGYTWIDIKDVNQFKIEQFCYKFLDTTFIENEEEQPLAYYENKGVAVVDDNELRIAPLNFSDYIKNDKFVAIHVCDNTDICVDKKNKISQKTIDELIKFNNLMSSLQETVSPSPVKKLKDYDIYDDETNVIVRITDINNSFYAETVNPEYNVIKGKIKIPSSIRSINRQDFQCYLKVNDYITVRLQNDQSTPFCLYNAFEDFYKDYADVSYGEEFYASFLSSYSIGNSWITENGLVVNIRNSYNKDIQEYIDNVIENRLRIYVKVSNSNTDSHGKFLVNGINAEEYDAEDINDNRSEKEFLEDAKKTIIKSFINWSEPDYIIKEDPKSPKIDKKAILPLSHFFYKRAFINVESTSERYLNLLTARMFATLCESVNDTLFILQEMDFVSNITHFAEGEDPNNLSLKISENIIGNDRVQYRQAVVEALKEYKENKLQINELLELSDTEKLDKIKDIIKASNILINKISDQELMRIKKSIVSTLGAADMYKYNTDNLTYYGEESDTLEFKSSIVFPSVNKCSDKNTVGEPTRQKWEILKAVCGFLNSISGGEVLLGVRDNGYPCGLKEDINYLFNNKKIEGASIDKYLLYIKYIIDSAFCDKSGIDIESKEITQVRISYSLDKNKEEKDIVRIKISPYEYGIISFKNKDELPAGMSLSYQRSGNTTAPITDEIERQIIEKKLSIMLDDEKRKIFVLQNAKKLKKQVILKDYNSSSRKKDRLVEPYKVMLEHKAVVCYDVEKKEKREYKLGRFPKAIQIDKNWTTQCENESFDIDIFDILKINNEFHIVLKLYPLAYNLLKEERTLSVKYMKVNTDSDSSEYPWILDTMVYDLVGIGRFYIGLADSIKIVEAEGLKEYIKGRIENINNILVS